ncbi:hypothetical protein SEA_PHLOP_41 [Gordonia phage Phlop]|uniref:Uncharacterized protein n=7 Tax=Wizardvirus TaxID=2169658 RepID=A0A890V0T0_9CAUD|nr:hypothetical protein KNU09_gp42 [Gordonia phage TillyBobJoe]YP_010100843.1 hypothetical protein KNU39_gp41 [Gordonia phage Mutzi]YP_010102004.1 hypothetical protein KNU53_gp42 [Gordonia phage SmokingBunny]YP_010102197.1 hypothetical protein KNU55_gp44 [Gordonia phage Barb]YP_010103646.1 hypothetical protein KNU68_gp42 [Gordonia phage Nubi]YP_010104257.1 hypothetical protein KNU74_gp43 [Gordonia phage Fireball]YP_010114960.1 hypothetical protein KNV78_gp41 [Gordonia phage Phlop]QXO14423.1 
MIRWPWSRREDREAARRTTRQYEIEAEKSAKRREDAERLAVESRASTDALREQMRLNGWTEMFAASWGGRGAAQEGRG